MLDQISSFLGHHDCRGINVSADNEQHYAGINHSEPIDAMYL
jgi:hypothetical protein